MSFPIDSPHFTLQLEQALRCLTRGPGQTAKFVEQHFRTPAGNLQAWLDRFNGGRTSLSNARIDEVKIEVGAIVVTKIPAPAKPIVNTHPEETPPASSKPLSPNPAPTPAPAPVNPQPTSAPTMPTAYPYTLGRRPQKRVVVKFLDHLKQIAGGGKIPDDESLVEKLEEWFGHAKPSITAVEAFLEFMGDLEETEVTGGGFIESGAGEGGRQAQGRGRGRQRWPGSAPRTAGHRLARPGRGPQREDLRRGAADRARVQ